MSARPAAVLPEGGAEDYFQLKWEEPGPSTRINKIQANGEGLETY